MNVVITGGSKGIGKAIAERFVIEGAHVFICSRHHDQLQQAANELRTLSPNAKVSFAVADLSKQDEVNTFAKSVMTEFSRIDMLVNNAGTFIPGQIIHEEEGLLQTLIETNLYSAYHLTRKLLPAMMNEKKGHIFNICSVASLQAYPHGGSYSISKFALLGFSKNLREELQPHGIKVTAVCPGATMSDSWSGSDVDADRIMKASDIADIIWSTYNLSPQAVVEDIILRPQLGDL